MSQRTRLWDNNWNLLYDSDTDPRTPEQYLRDQALAEANFTVDNDDARVSGRVTRDENDAFQAATHLYLLERIAVPPNPIFDTQ
ncbi:hypothetical protein [Mycolicibacterium sp. F2034L]|uniref:hypothetical protein n=1 Tax=Mycolicibacterium sp. F2034L TaxID=2926422 RepID=UPI001FF32D63|nr:hypothetical protein [Mycolicibacterium sp. F2034L]MCK0174791.1 hypothetical protein [Mycolicibacterium sp. F2034L]